MNLETLRALVREALASMENDDRVRTSWVATQACKLADPDGISPPIISFAAHQEFCQVAREVLRREFEKSTPDDPGMQQHPLFPGLQVRYPKKREDGEEPEYVRLELLTREDGIFNVERLRATGRSYLRAADLLEAYIVHKFDAEKKDSA